jgi:hypothetical protein
MRLLRGVAGKVLGCGCLVGIYETYGGSVIATIDARGPSCEVASHRLHEELPAAQLMNGSVPHLQQTSAPGTVDGA